MIAKATPPIGLRWTIGDVNPRGFEALRLSIWGAWRLFGTDASYAVCVNSVSVDEARTRTGEVPAAVAWGDASDDLPRFLRACLDGGMAEGAAWKFAPLRVFPERFELALDNDCILWRLPEAIESWLARGDGACLLAEDVRTMFGAFAEFCAPAPRNCGLRGLPPGFDLGAALEEVLRRKPKRLTTELDEQGLQVAAMSRPGMPRAVPLHDLSVCSPFHPHLPDLGRCGAHFVGLNTKHICWDYYDRPADAWMAEHWARHAPFLYHAVGLAAPAYACSSPSSTKPLTSNTSGP